MRVASLGSGSKGNATLVEAGDTLVMVDSGLAYREVKNRLYSLGVKPSDIDAVLVTHEHSDHVRSVNAISNAYDLPVFLTAGTATNRNLHGLAKKVLIRPGDQFVVGELEVAAEPVPHDAREPVQFCLHYANQKLGILTDLGSITPHIVRAFSNCDAMLLEFNYDPKMLAEGPYPDYLKSRVASDFGHLANTQARDFLDLAGTEKLRTLFLAHISQQNNHPDLVTAALADWSDSNQCTVIRASQQQGFEWHSLDPDKSTETRVSQFG